MATEWLLPFHQPGYHHSQQRKMLRRGIGPQRIGSHNDKIEQSATKLMLELSKFEGNPCPLIARLVLALNRGNIVADRHAIGLFSKVGRIVVEIAYGKKILETTGEDLLSWNKQLMHLTEEAFVRFWLVDMLNFRASLLSFNLPFHSCIPAVRFIPSWFPGAEFR